MAQPSSIGPRHVLIARVLVAGLVGTAGGSSVRPAARRQPPELAVKLLVVVVVVLKYSVGLGGVSVRVRPDQVLETGGLSVAPRVTCCGRRSAARR